MLSTRRSRTLSLATALAMTASLAVAASARAEPSAGATDTQSTTPPEPLIFGTAAPSKANLQAQEAIAGREIVAVRVYRLWADQLFGPDQIWERDTFHTIFLSVKPVRSDGTVIPWADIAAATPGTPLYQDMVGMADQIKAFGDRVYLTFSHEPEAAPSTFGTGADFAAAFRNFVTVMRTEHANVRPVVIFTGYGFKRTDAKNIASYYPGDDYVSAVGVDLYNWGSCRGRPWTSLATLLEAARLWGLAHPSKPMLLTEWGSVEDPSNPGAKAAWITDSANLLTQPGYEQFAGVFAWGALNPHTACPFGYDTSTAAQNSWAAVGHEPAYSAWE